jgi:hypothetical protein
VEDAQAKPRPLSQKVRDWVNGFWMKRNNPESDLAPIEALAQSSDALMCWHETDQGRARVWCKICRDQGKDWLSLTPCEHIQKADPGETIPFSTAMETLKKLMSEPVPQRSE